MNFHLRYWLVTYSNYAIVFSQAQLNLKVEFCAHCEGIWGNEYVAPFIPDLCSRCS